MIADLILAGPDTAESRTTLKAKHNAGDAAPYLRYIAARYGSFPNVWLCLCNEYDIKNPNYTQAEIAELGVTFRRFLPYPTPLSVHDGSKIGWSAKFDSLPEWADHQIIQRKIRTIAPAADAIDFVWRGEDGEGPRRKPTVNDELSYEGDREITFWELAPDKAADVFPDLDHRFRVMAWPGRGTCSARTRPSPALLPTYLRASGRSPVTT